MIWVIFHFHLGYLDIFLDFCVEDLYFVMCMMSTASQPGQVLPSPILNKLLFFLRTLLVKNESLKNVTFPGELKHGVVLLIFQIGDFQMIDR